MSNCEKKCECSWCKHGITTEESRVVRTNFIAEVFVLALSRLFTVPMESLTQIKADFSAIVMKFFEDKDAEGEMITDAIVDLAFQAVGKTDLKPSDIVKKCSTIRAMIGNVFTGLKVDVRMDEAPILNKLLTPEILVNYELDEIDYPAELLALYRAHQEKSSGSGLLGLISGLQEALEQSGLSVVTGQDEPEEPKHTVH